MDVVDLEQAPLVEPGKDASRAILLRALLQLALAVLADRAEVRLGGEELLQERGPAAAELLRELDARPRIHASNIEQASRHCRCRAAAVFRLAALAGLPKPVDDHSRACEPRSRAASRSVNPPRCRLAPGRQGDCQSTWHEQLAGLPVRAAPIMPTQFFPGPATKPENRLMLAVLEDAVDIYRKHAHLPGRRSRLVVETEEWLFSDDTSWPLSFVNVCRALGIDVDWLRGRLRASRPAPEAPALAEAS